ncbi:hypothetical protein K190097F3_56430 [Enterocloster clostridioformis]
MPAAWLGTERMCLVVLYCHGVISRTFFVKEQSFFRSGNPIGEEREDRKHA